MNDLHNVPFGNFTIWVVPLEPSPNLHQFYIEAMQGKERYSQVVLSCIEIMHFEFFLISRELRGLTLTATFTDDIIHSIRSCSLFIPIMFEEELLENEITLSEKNSLFSIQIASDVTNSNATSKKVPIPASAR